MKRTTNFIFLVTLLFYNHNIAIYP